jgi:hypothetical protein
MSDKETTWLLSAKDWYLKNELITKELYQSIDRGKYSMHIEGYNEYRKAKKDFYKETFQFYHDYLTYCIKQASKEQKNHKNGTVIHKALEDFIDDYTNTQYKVKGM